MRGFWWRLPVLRGLSPMRKGLVEVLGIQVVLWPLMAFCMSAIAAKPSQDLLGALAQIGATLLIAYTVEVSWLVRASRSRPPREREKRLGALLGIGASGLFGIALALGLSERAQVHHWGWLDRLAFAWVVLSLLFFAIAVVMQPLIVHEWDDDQQWRRRRVTYPRAPIRRRQS